jgi:hypothetical protein
MNPGSRPIDFELTSMDPDLDSKWLQWSSSEGVIAANSSQTVTLTFLTAKPQTYSTYLLISNSENPEDMKTIRVNMEVVLSGKREAKKAFGVLVDGKSGTDTTTSVLDMGEVFIGQMVRHHYLEIQNLSSTPLEFQVTSNVPVTHEEDELNATELHFSLSITSLKSFHSLRVEAQSSAKVYVLYKPNKYGGQINYDDQIELYVKCRLVKDFQQIVQLCATCLRPQMLLSNSYILFSNNNNVIEPNQMDIAISNLSDTEDLNYVVRSDFCVFFDVEVNGDDYEGSSIPARMSQKLTVIPNLALINDPQHANKKYIEEHFTIYNKKNMKEKSWVTLQFTRGYLRQFYTAPGPKSAYAFTTLEDSIVRLLRQFKMLDAPLDKLYFDLRYLTDELVFYGLKGSVGQYFFDLAKLLYRVLVGNKSFTNVLAQQNTNLLKQFVGQLTHFLSYFPEREELSSLWELHNSLNA